MSGEYIKQLGAKHMVADYEKIVEEYEVYRKRHVDNLAYVDENMLMAYECAFFFHRTGIKHSTTGASRKINQKIFRAALGEIKQKYICSKTDVCQESKKDGIVCNLYSICGSSSLVMRD
ncbi:hypothetical protein HK407_02g03810 [Ordospora pajunii]|jgi:hypothetical protein|uniref:uncharacterized protein n=1 Tax=Ordospora pajunii TaxID=3039483 RepID=UPI0029526D64|nr:uncharacterized protein HK407_02g03810 [Ordospora pajunii]KAH9411935.1 hypothetical protein HK407_02g03810 [Ordospora pajunii]